MWPFSWWKHSHTGLSARVAVLREEKAAIKEDISAAMSKTVASIASLQAHHANLAELHTEAHSI